MSLQKQGFEPDLIIGHPGWGETLFLREVFPRAKQILYGELYYRTKGGDIGFDPEFRTLTIEERFRISAKNATMALALIEADRIVCPTPFQASTLPEVLQPRTQIIHEGIDIDQIQPRPSARLKFASGVVLDGSTPVITFINRRLEPLRGFHILMRALPKVLTALPSARAVLVGADERGYGPPAPNGRTWKQHLLSEVGGRLDPSRVHFTGQIPHDYMLSVLSVSAAHVYYTYPFVLSWSALEAMASACLIVGSDTAPVRDVIENGTNGLLHDFFDVDDLAETLIQACREPDQYRSMRQEARRTVVERFDRARMCLPAWLRLIDEVRTT
jgi:glycosyltransferase involved in cell wall biosynthesis